MPFTPPQPGIVFFLASLRLQLAEAERLAALGSSAFADAVLHLRAAVVCVEAEVAATTVPDDGQ
jgi:hypothetical protein